MIPCDKQSQANLGLTAVTSLFRYSFPIWGASSLLNYEFKIESHAAVHECVCGYVGLTMMAALR